MTDWSKPFPVGFVYRFDLQREVSPLLWSSENLGYTIPAHYFTRNRTLGSDFPSFFLNASAVPTIVPRCFRMLFKQQQRMALPLGRV